MYSCSHFVLFCFLAISLSHAHAVLLLVGQKQMILKEEAHGTWARVFTPAWMKPNLSSWHAFGKSEEEATGHSELSTGFVGLPRLLKWTQGTKYPNFPPS